MTQVNMATTYAQYSFWLETSGDDLTPRPPLEGIVEADVAILGAGFTGLWTAYYLLEREPSLRVVVLEKHIAGFGASGRNGGGSTQVFRCRSPNLPVATEPRRRAPSTSPCAKRSTRWSGSCAAKVSTHSSIGVAYCVWPAAGTSCRLSRKQRGRSNGSG